MNRFSYSLIVAFWALIFTGLAHQALAQTHNPKQEQPAAKQEGQRHGRMTIPEEEGSEIAALRRRAAEKKAQREATDAQQPARSEKARVRKTKRKSPSH